MAMTRAEIQARYRERKRNGLVQPRGEPTRIELLVRKQAELRAIERSEERARFLAVLDRVHRAIDDPDGKEVAWEAYREVAAWP